MTKIHTISFIVGFLAFQAVPVRAAEHPIVAVFQIEVRDLKLSDKVLVTLTDYLGTALSEGGHYRVVPTEDIRKALVDKKKESYKACFDQACQIELGRELAANKSLSTTVLRIGGACVVTARLYDLKSSATDTSAKQKGACTEQGLMESLDQVAQQFRNFAQGIVPQPTGQAVATAPVPQAQASVASVMLAVPAGGFKMGSSGGAEDERPAHQVTLATFAIDQTEVTVAQYRDCVNASGCQAPAKGPKCNYPEAGRSAHPVNCVSWGQAQQYCEWAGKRLCTEAEWEKAARGAEGQAFPWGSAPASCNTAILQEGGPGCGKQTTAPVGSKPAGRSPYDVDDLIGNVWEWVADFYDKGYYAVSPSADPKGPETGSARVIRGGGFASPPTVTSSARQRLNAPTQLNFVGFRCCK